MKHSVLLIGLDKNNKVLLHHKSADAPHNANQWCMLGGGVEEGESKEEAIKREMKEELNLDLEPEFFKSYRHSESWGDVERNVFSAKIDEDIEELKKYQTEGDGMEFFSREKMKDLIINENHFFIIEEFFLEKF